MLNMTREQAFIILGINKNSTFEEIKKAYRKKVMENHPDRITGDKEIKKANETMAKINAAYELLTKRNTRNRLFNVDIKDLQKEKIDKINEIITRILKEFNLTILNIISEEKKKELEDIKEKYINNINKSTSEIGINDYYLDFKKDIYTKTFIIFINFFQFNEETIKLLHINFDFNKLKKKDINFFLNFLTTDILDVIISYYQAILKEAINNFKKYQSFNMLKETINKAFFYDKYGNFEEEKFIIEISKKDIRKLINEKINTLNKLKSDINRIIFDFNLLIDKMTGHKISKELRKIKRIAIQSREEFKETFDIEIAEYMLEYLNEEYQKLSNPIILGAIRVRNMFNSNVY